MGYTEPVWERSALVTIDMQRDFVLDGAPAQVLGTLEVVPAVADLVESYRAAGLPVIHVVRAYPADGNDVDLCRRQLIEDGARIVLPGSPGAGLVDELVPEGAAEIDWDQLLDAGIYAIAPSEWVLYKPRWGAFYRTPLERHLRELGVDTVVFAGCNFPNCPRTSIYEASERDLRVAFVPDACSQVYERGLAELEAIGVSIVELADVQSSVAGR
jgi:nicotinamidase-related amidase